MAANLIPPFWLVSEPAVSGQRTFALPAGLRRRAATGESPVVLYAEGATAPFIVDFEDRQGRQLGARALRPGELTGALLPLHTTRLVARNADRDLRLGHYPLSRLALRWQALRHGALRGSLAARFATAGVAVHELRRRLKRALWVSPAAALIGLPDYRRFRARYVGDFREVTPADAAPALDLVTQAADIPLQRLAACAQSLAMQTDPHFRWLVAIPAARHEQEGPALAAALGGHAEIIETMSTAPAACLAEALAATTNGLVAPLDASGVLTRDAVALVRASFVGQPDCDFLYTDEEYLDAAGQPRDPAYKPAFNRHLLQAMNYIGSLAVMRGPRARELGLRPGFEGAALFDLILRYVDDLPPSRIRHLPRIAYSSAEDRPGFADAPTAGHAAEALAQLLGVPVEVDPTTFHLRPLYAVPQPPPLVSIVIPTRDRGELLDMTLRTLIACTAYRNFEIIIVDNGSVEPATFALFDEIRATWPATSIVRDDGNFNFSRLCNDGIAAARGDLILLLNNDIEIVEPGWLDEMVALAMLAPTGIVGAKLLYPDRTVQHAGFIIGLRSGAGSHWFTHSAADAPGYQERLIARQNLSAVTGACLMIRRDCLEAAGVLDEVRFAEDCNDVDLCLRARRAGFEVVFTPFAVLIHHESASRGDDRTVVVSQRRTIERAQFEALWGEALRTDPHFSPNFKRDNEYALRATSPQGSRAPRTDKI